MSLQSMENFYNGQNLFVTGGTGFVGKVLIEKLLVAFPNIGNIYVLLRSGKNGESPQHRLQEELIKSKIFTLRKDFRYNFEKLIVISGDMTKPRLGLSDDDYQLLTEKVSIVFHSAATVRFHGPLKKFINHNVLGTQAIMELCRDIKNLQCVIYVSTAYANCNLLNVEEKVYPLPESPEVLIKKILDENSNETPQNGHPALMGRPNSYTISKAIAESLVVEKYSDLPVVICRPSIVTHSFAEPVPGWCDSFNGLAGTLILGALGIARTMEINCDYNADIIPVDFVANALIVTSYHSVKFSDERKLVVHITSGHMNPINWGQILDYVRVVAVKNPSVKMIRPVANNPVSSKGHLGKLKHQFTSLFSHIIFAYLFDFVLFLACQPRFMIDVTRKMYRAFDVLEHFTNRQWFFSNNNYQKIFSCLSKNEQCEFQSNVKTIDWTQYCSSIYMGCRRYLLNEDDSSIKEGLCKQKRLKIIYGALDIIIYSFLIVLAGLIWFYAINY